MYLKRMKIFKISQIHPLIHMLNQFVVAHLHFLFNYSNHFYLRLLGLQSIRLIHLEIQSNYRFHLFFLFYQKFLIVIFRTCHLIQHFIIHFEFQKYYLFLNYYLELILFNYYSHYNPFLIL